MKACSATRQQMNPIYEKHAYVSKYYWIAMGEFTFELAWAFAALEVISLGITRVHRLLLDSASLSFCLSQILRRYLSFCDSWILRLF